MLSIAIQKANNGEGIEALFSPVTEAQKAQHKTHLLMNPSAFLNNLLQPNIVIEEAYSRSPLMPFNSPMTMFNSPMIQANSPMLSFNGFQKSPMMHTPPSYGSPMVAFGSPSQAAVDFTQKQIDALVSDPEGNYLTLPTPFENSLGVPSPFLNYHPSPLSSPPMLGMQPIPGQSVNDLTRFLNPINSGKSVYELLSEQGLLNESHHEVSTPSVPVVRSVRRVRTTPLPDLREMVGIPGVHETVPQGKFWNIVKDEDQKTLYQCPFPHCEKTFTRPYNLKSHYRQHTGERPFGCDQCASSFARKHDLKRHQQLHSGKKPFYCPGCSRGFQRGDALKRHLKPLDRGTSTPCALRLDTIATVAEIELERAGINGVISLDSGCISAAELAETLRIFKNGLYEDPMVQRMLGGDFDCFITNSPSIQ